jgi:hypothetical protein
MTVLNTTTTNLEDIKKPSANSKLPDANIDQLRKEGDKTLISLEIPDKNNEIVTHQLGKIKFSKKLLNVVDAKFEYNHEIPDSLLNADILTLTNKTDSPLKIKISPKVRNGDSRNEWTETIEPRGKLQITKDDFKSNRRTVLVEELKLDLEK